ncbi:MAG: peptidylprolyl isomerase [Saprospiraceae bacterium]
MKKLFIIWLCVSIAGVVAAQRAVVDKVIGKVGSELVLLSEVEEQYALMAAQNGNVPTGARCNIMDALLVNKLLLNQAKLDSVEVSEDDVETQLNARIERILAYMNNDVSQFEAYYGQTINQVKEQFREDLRSQILTDRMRAQIMKDVTVTPSEVKAFFNDIPKDSLPYFNSEVEISEIVYAPKVNAEEKQKAIDKLKEIRRRIVEGGEDFAAMAQKFSDDGSARGGGDLGWTRRGKFVPEFEAAAYNLDQGEISDIVESEFGFHLIQLLERRGNSIHVRHILIKPEVTDADLQAARTLLDSVRQLVMSDSVSFSIAVKRFSDKNVQSYNNDGRMVNPATGNTFFEVGDLDPDIYFATDSMEVGGISAPFEFRNPVGEINYRMVRLQSRTAPHRASLQLDYFKIQQAAIEAKKNEFINTWVMDKIDNTYIYIDPMFSDCTLLDKWRDKRVRP